MAIRMSAKVVRRPSLPLTECDERALAVLSTSRAHRDALARMSGLLGALATESASGNGLDRILGAAFQVVSIVMPRLDLFCQSGWLVRGWTAAEPWIGWAAIQTLVFIPLVLAAAMFDFSRKRI